MKARCSNKNSKKYKYYGGREISFDPRWTKFENFLFDMGERPSAKHTLERRDVNKGYNKENCYWATGPTQSRNRRYTKLSMGAARAIRKMYASGLFTQKEIAFEFNIHKGHVPAIIANKYWIEGRE